jgi:Cys-tRNA(Pro)/Cys-tRNA(Cys) deacylase
LIWARAILTLFALIRFSVQKKRIVIEKTLTREAITQSAIMTRYLLPANHMTPAIQLARKSSIFHRVHEYQHDPEHTSYGMEAAEKMNVDEKQVFKTLVVALDTGKLAVAIIPVSARLSMKMVAQALGAKKADMAEAAEVQRSTGYVLGGVSPLGQKKALKTVIDSSAECLSTLFVSAGKRGLEIELKPADLLSLTAASYFSICQ